VARHDEALFGRDRQRHPDGVPAPQHQGDRGLVHAGDQLGQGQPGLHIAPHRVEHQQQAVDFRTFLDGGQLGHQMLVLCGLGLAGQGHMALDLPDDGEAMDPVPALGGNGPVRHAFVKFAQKNTPTEAILSAGGDFYAVFRGF